MRHATYVITGSLRTTTCLLIKDMCTFNTTTHRLKYNQLYVATLALPKRHKIKEAWQCNPSTGVHCNILTTLSLHLTLALHYLYIQLASCTYDAIVVRRHARLYSTYKHMSYNIGSNLHELRGTAYRMKDTVFLICLHQFQYKGCVTSTTNLSKYSKEAFAFN